MKNLVIVVILKKNSIKNKCISQNDKTTNQNLYKNKRHK